MSAMVDEARQELAKWDARVAEDKASLRTVERQANEIRERLDQAERCAKSLRTALQQYDRLREITAPPFVAAAPASVAMPMPVRTLPSA